MTATAGGRFQRRFLGRPLEMPWDGTDELLQAVERLEKAILSLNETLSAQVGGFRKWPLAAAADEVADSPSLDDIKRTLVSISTGEARFIRAMLHSNGKTITDAELSAVVRCSQASLKVFACMARAALRDVGIEKSVRRARCAGYYMTSEDAARFVALCLPTSGDSTSEV